MTTTPDQIAAANPDLSQKAIQKHGERLDARYFDTFDPRSIGEHIRALDRIGADTPVQTLVRLLPEGMAQCTILGIDYPSVFSLIAGVLTAHGFTIITGEVFTCRPDERASGGARRRRSPRRSPATAAPRRHIIDQFRGSLDAAGQPRDTIEAMQQTLERVVRLLGAGDQGAAQARQIVNEAVAGRLRALRPDVAPFLLPLDLSFEQTDGPFTALEVAGQDTPAFLYALSSALSLQGIAIERISIQTSNQTVADRFELADSYGKPLDQKRIPRITLAVLLTKQFTCFLGNAPDPYRALVRFERLIADVTSLPQQPAWATRLSDPRLLQDLARLLGISDYLWEDFIRGQYEHILPLLSPADRARRLSRSPEDLHRDLAAIAEGAGSLEDKIEAINTIKDNEIFRLDLEHIFAADDSFGDFSQRLTLLAEAVVATIARITYDDLTRRFGAPRSVAGIEASYAICGLGKLGGAALGYASDIELLLVYSDSGRTEGPRGIDNAEFFDRFVKQAIRGIRAKREGIFTVDLRLRPFGKDGPLASSLANFIRYYGPEGSAHSYERLALVRLRAIAGDPELGARIERLRDQYVYAANLIVPADIQRLRQRQWEEKKQGNLLNAKYSPGGLVDIEYDVQLLQVMYGATHSRLRTPRIRAALRALSEIGVLSSDESDRLGAAYDFLRNLINGLRMLRGSARDLFLPRAGDPEFAHLARRMGYRPGDRLSAARQLHVDFSTHTAVVRQFVERHFGRESLPDGHIGNIADLILREQTDPETILAALREAGFSNPDRALVNVRELAGHDPEKVAFARLAVLAVDMLQTKPDPDMALNNWERFMGAIADPTAHFERMLAQPARLDILLSIFAGSQFLADILVKNPLCIDWATQPDIIHAPRDQEAMAQELRDINASYFAHDLWLDALRVYRNRELLRIGARDICFKAPIGEITADLSLLARQTVAIALERTWQRLPEHFRPLVAGGDPSRAFCIMAFGKLGGNELNYSSDIDLMAVCDDALDLNETIEGRSWRELFAHVMTAVRADLSAHTSAGYCYRVDLRLRPYGRTGQLVYGEDALLRYYADTAAPWELQALLKIWPAAGARDLGMRIRDRLGALLPERIDPRTVADSVRSMRARGRHRAEAHGGIDIKNGDGGIRDIEFLVQALQLRHLREHAELFERTTSRALELLRTAGIISPDDFAALAEDYIFLRRLEHFLQIFNDLQTHTLTTDPAQSDALARRLLGPAASGEELHARLRETMIRTRERFERRLSA